ncbi:hypothetical protein ACP70R_004519 [Stipagrostis hirtigluma subsp. patula]
MSAANGATGGVKVKTIAVSKLTEIDHTQCGLILPRGRASLITPAAPILGFLLLSDNARVTCKTRLLTRLDSAGALSRAARHSNTSRGEAARGRRHSFQFPAPNSPIRPNPRFDRLLLPSRRRRRSRPAMASPDEPVDPGGAEEEKPPPALSDELLEEIFVKVDSPDDLARAATACPSFHRLITDPVFLRRYRSVHPPLLLGFVSEGFRPAEAPHRNARAARAVADAGGFKFDYVPAGWRPWQRIDAQDGRVLLENLPRYERPDGFFFPDLAVCDPLSRRYLALPPIPEDIATSVLDKDYNNEYFRAFLVPAGHEEEEETSFRVICRMHGVDKVVAFVFSSASSSWSAGASSSWSVLGSEPPCTLFVWSQYENGCFYWKFSGWNKLLKLNISSMEFSIVDLPPDHEEREVVIMDAGEGRLEMFSHMRHSRSVHHHAIKQNEVDGADEWVLKGTITLPASHCSIVGASAGYIFVTGIQSVQGKVSAVCCSLEIKTKLFEMVSSIGFSHGHAHPYFGFPPFMSPRRI